MSRVIPGLLVLLLAVSSAAHPADARYDFSSVTEFVQRMVDERAMKGAAMALIKNDRVIYKEVFGAFQADTVLPIASASKWFAVTPVLALVDDGVFSLDAKVSDYIPLFTGDKASMTIRHGLSCMTGISNSIPRNWLKDTSITLKQCVERVADVDLLHPPGEKFQYGGWHFQTAARVAEMATGKPWHQIFGEKLTGPLGLADTYHGNLVYVENGTERGSLIGSHFDSRPTLNPHIAGGIATTLNDYIRFMRMLANDGVFEGKRVLSSDSVHEMLRVDQTHGAEVAYAAGRGASFLGYGLGSWILRVDSEGNILEVADPGAGGTTPWIDFEFEVAGVIMTATSVLNIREQSPVIREMVRKIVGKPGS